MSINAFSLTALEMIAERAGTTVYDIVYFCSSFETLQNSLHQSHEVPLHAKYGGRNTVTLIPGDGIGPEMVTAVQDIFRYSRYLHIYFVAPLWLLFAISLSCIIIGNKQYVILV